MVERLSDTHYLRITVYPIIAIASMDSAELFKIGDISHTVRILWEDTTPLMQAQDIANILDIDAVSETNDDEEHVVRQDVMYVTEHGLYSILMKSNNPSAQPFQKWITRLFASVRDKGYNELQQEHKTATERGKRNKMINTFSEEEWSLIYYNKHTPCLYLAYLDKDNPEILKFGETENMQQRAKCHRNNWPNFYLLAVFKCHNGPSLEQDIKVHPKLKQFIGESIVSGKKSCETIRLTSTLTLEKVKTYIQERVDAQNSRHLRIQGSLQCDVATQTTEIGSCKDDQNQILQLRLRNLELELELIQQKYDLVLKSPNALQEQPTQQISQALVATVATMNATKSVRPVAKIPLLSIPVSLTIAYNEWTEKAKGYYLENSRPPWKAQLGNNAQAHKARYARMKPFFIYLDRCTNPADAIQKLNDIRIKHGVPASAFIRNCFYYLYHPVPPIPCKITILPSVLREEMLALGLAVPPCLFTEPIKNEDATQGNQSLPIVMGKYTIGGRSFNTLTATIEYIRGLINTIGLCDSVKGKDPMLFDQLHAVLQQHPDSEEKLSGMTDIRVVSNKFKNGKEVYIVKANGDMVDMSWRLCASGKPKTLKAELLSALRYSIEDQIQEFKGGVCIDRCTACNRLTCGSHHIDHVTHFAKLVQDFHGSTELRRPTTFIDAEDGSNRRDFRLDDKEYADAWKAYHKQHATLRVLCKSCNLTREKHKA